jgi:hypothetical protein
MSKISGHLGKSESGGYALQACARMLRPVVSLALRFGLKYHDMDTMMKKLLLEEAGKELARTKGSAPSASQLSVTTGVHRKEIRRFLEEGVDESNLPSSERSIAAMVFALWLRKTDTRVLPLQSSGRQLSFEKLALQIGSDVHFRSVLGELTRLGLVTEKEGHIERLQDDFIPQGADAQMLSLLANNVNAHVNAGVSNVCQAKEPFLEQVVWANGFSRDACVVAQESARATWQQARLGLLKKLEEVNPDTPPPDPHRLRIGMYMFYEPMTNEGAIS